MECLNRWNPSKGQGSRIVNSRLDVNKKTTINKIQYGD